MNEPSPEFVVDLAAGLTRYTVDIDATVSGAATTLEHLLATLGRHQIQPRIPDAPFFARERQAQLV